MLSKVLVAIAFICQITFVICVARNMATNKSLVKWLSPEGTTRNERGIIFFSFTMSFVFFLIAAFLARG